MLPQANVDISNSKTFCIPCFAIRTLYNYSLGRFFISNTRVRYNLRLEARVKFSKAFLRKSCKYQTSTISLRLSRGAWLAVDPQFLTVPSRGYPPLLVGVT